MAKPYKIQITDGQGSSAILNGTYSVTSNTNGYNNASITPSSQTVSEETNNYAFTIAATGTLTLHVSETGTAEGTSIVGATFKRCDKNGTEYGDVITTNENGNAVFNNIPFSQTDTINVYYKQLSSDGEHEFDNTLKTTSLEENTKTIEIQNASAVTRQITLTDANYSNLPIELGEITFD